MTSQLWISAVSHYKNVHFVVGSFSLVHQGGALQVLRVCFDPTVPPGVHVLKQSQVSQKPPASNVDTEEEGFREAPPPTPPLLPSV